MLLINGDCLEKMKDIPDKSVDLIFCDLPYGQTSCKWDCQIDLDEFWKQVMRIKIINAPIIMTTTTKFGVSLINSAPKKCPFRYDLVWCKSASCGFLSAKKMPMRKHEMIYVFYEKLPFYDLSSHKHKFINQETNNNKINDKQIYNGGKAMKVISDGKGHQYNPPLPVSVVKEEDKQIIKGENNTYNTEGRKKPIISEKAGKYETPLPVSVVKEPVVNEEYDKREKKVRNTIKKEENYGKGYLDKKVNFRKYDPTLGGKGAPSHLYDPPLPVSVVKEEKTQISKPQEKNLYGASNGGTIGNVHGTNYNPPLPVSVVKEEVDKIDEKYKNKGGLYSKVSRNGLVKNEPHYNPPLPVSVVKEIPQSKYNHNPEQIYNPEYLEKKIDSGGSSVQDNVLSGGKVENVDLDDQNNIISEVLNDIIESISS